MVYSLLKTISDAANTKDYPVDKLKIVGSSDDVPARVFGYYIKEGEIHFANRV